MGFGDAMRAASLVIIMALSAAALGVSLGDVLLVAVDKIPDHVYVVLNNTPVPLPKVYILELKEAVWAEGTYNPKKPINLTVPVFSGPYLAIPKGAGKVERGKKAVLEINGRTYEILYTDDPERDGLPPTRVELILKGREIRPGVYNIDNKTATTAEGRWRVPPEASTAASSFG